MQAGPSREGQAEFARGVNLVAILSTVFRAVFRGDVLLTDTALSSSGHQVMVLFSVCPVCGRTSRFAGRLWWYSSIPPKRHHSGNRRRRDDDSSCLESRSVEAEHLKRAWCVVTRHSVDVTRRSLPPPSPFQDHKYS